MKRIYYKVKIGYEKDDFISIDDTELAKAVRAQVQGGVVLFKEGSVSGNSIISIVPDWNRVMGFKRDYKLQGEDYDRIGEEVINEARMALDSAKMGVSGSPQNQAIGGPMKTLQDNREDR